ncbi:MAG: LysR family transcriptional regulator [Bacteroidales bacterium]|nr:LysR family transcriptional regulator [Bacteroidales bacterium]
MELRQLRYFIAVAQTLNFSEAARRLFITQGTLSQQILQLEDELGSRLFDRSSHSVVLTEAGMELLPLAQKTIQDSEICISHLVDLRKLLAGTLSIGLTQTFRQLFTESLNSFTQLYPGVKLKIYYKTSVELYAMLRKREVDFVLAYKPAQYYDYVESDILFSSKLQAIMRKDHPLAEKKEVELADLQKYGIVLPGSGLQARKAFEKFLNVNTSGLNVRMELNDPNIILDILQRSHFVSVLSSLAVHYRANLVAVPIKDIDRELEGCVHWLKGIPRKRSAEAFLSLLKDSAQVHRIMLDI